MLNWTVRTIRLALCSMSIALSSIISFAQPSSEGIAQLLQRGENGTIKDCYYINQLFEKCTNLDQVENLSKLLRSEFSNTNQKKRTKIATARRLSFLGKHRQAIWEIRSLRRNEFDKLGTSLKSEYFHTIGYIALNSGNPDIAFEYYQKAAALSKRSGNIELYQYQLSSIGVALNAKKLVSKALKYFQKALALETKGENRNSLYIRLNMALTQFNLGELEIAKSTFQSALPIIKAKEDTYAEIRTLGNLGDIYLQQDSIELAMQHFKIAEELALVHNQTMDLIRINSGLSQAYEKLGNHFEALQLLKSVHRLDSALNTGISESLTAFELQEEIKGKNAINAQIKQERDSERQLKQWLFIAVIVLILILITLIVYILGYRNKKRHLLQREIATSREKLASNPNKYAEIIDKLEQIVSSEERFKEEGLTLDQLAKLIGTNRSYLSEAINSHYEMSFTQWINNLRIRAAKELLMDAAYNHLSIEGIAKTAGFASISTFNSHFKKVTGLTPSYFRSQSQKLGNTAVSVTN